MEKNVHVRTLNYWIVVLETVSVSNHLSLIMIFVCVFIQLYTQQWSPQYLAGTSSLLSFLGYAIWDGFLKSLEAYGPLSVAERISIRTRFLNAHLLGWRIASSAILLTIILLGLSPMLKTLTKDISSDSLWAFTTLMFLANIIFHDYGSSKATTVRFPDSLSINAAIFASVLLASRLSSDMQVFALMLFSVQMFALFPLFQRYLRVCFLSLIRPRGNRIFGTLHVAPLLSSPRVSSFPRSILPFFGFT